MDAPPRNQGTLTEEEKKQLDEVRRYRFPRHPDPHPPRCLREKEFSDFGLGNAWTVEIMVDSVGKKRLADLQEFFGSQSCP